MVRYDSPYSCKTSPVALSEERRLVTVALHRRPHLTLFQSFSCKRKGNLRVDLFFVEHEQNTSF